MAMKFVWWTIVVCTSVGALLVAPAFGQQTAVLKSTVLSPAWRNTIQSHDPRKELHLVGQVQTSPMPSRIAVSLSSEAKAIWKKTARLKADGSFDFKTSLDRLPVGEY